LNQGLDIDGNKEEIKDDGDEKGIKEEAKNKLRIVTE
jgi:hypothetical protein